MGCFVVAEFLLTSASRGPSAIAEPLVRIAPTMSVMRRHVVYCMFFSVFFGDFFGRHAQSYVSLLTELDAECDQQSTMVGRSAVDNTEPRLPTSH